MAGSLRRDGYISLKIDGERMLAHRIAWLIVNGTDPLVIDHADGNRSNNSIRNLRDGTHFENCGNAKKHKAAKNPFKCVQWREKDSKWQARICVRGRRRSLGHFTTAEAAAAAYKAAALAEFGEYARFSTPDPDHADQIAELEVFAEIGRQWNADSSLAKWFPLTAERVEQDAQEIAKLRADLAAAVALIAARDETIAELELRLRISRQSNKELREAAEQAEARLSAIDVAPTVARVVEIKRDFTSGPYRCLDYDSDKLPGGFVELIARPAKD